jgi:hypothetical protein
MTKIGRNGAKSYKRLKIVNCCYKCTKTGQKDVIKCFHEFKVLCCIPKRCLYTPSCTIFAGNPTQNNGIWWFRLIDYCKINRLQLAPKKLVDQSINRLIESNLTLDSLLILLGRNFSGSMLSSLTEVLLFLKGTSLRQDVSLSNSAEECACPCLQGNIIDRLLALLWCFLFNIFLCFDPARLTHPLPVQAIFFDGRIVCK